MAALTSLSRQAFDELEQVPKLVILRSGDGQDPEVHRSTAEVHAAALQAALEEAYEKASRYYNAVGHLCPFQMKLPRGTVVVLQPVMLMRTVSGDVVQIVLSVN